jgi:hypothetical protein
VGRAGIVKRADETRVGVIVTKRVVDRIEPTAEQRAQRRPEQDGEVGKERAKRAVDVEEQARRRAQAAPLELPRQPAELRVDHEAAVRMVSSALA